ncbi:MAG: hypothetical protein RRY29_09765 [Desulfovibrionaceae bacterium]
MQKTLSCVQSVEAAAILFELNTRKDEIAGMSVHAALPQNPETARTIYLEWLAFVHAAIVYALMHKAPAAVVALYLRGTTELLETYADVDTQNAHSFIDSVFTPYMECLVQERQKDCPTLFLRKVTGQDSPLACPASMRVVSGVMAMALCSIIDALGQYEMLAE